MKTPKRVYVICNKFGKPLKACTKLATAKKEANRLAWSVTIYELVQPKKKARKA